MPTAITAPDCSPMANDATGQEQRLVGAVGRAPAASQMR